MLNGSVILAFLAMASACVQPQRTAPGRDEAVYPSGDPTSLAQQGTTDAAAFDRADRRARAVIGQIRCAQRVGGLRQRGVLGPIDSLGGRGQCTVVDGRYVGVFFDTDTLFTAVSRLSAVDLVSSTRHVEPLDTAAILAVARASRAAQLRGADAYRRAQRQYSPVAFRFDGDSIEVWLVPPAAFTGPPLTVGGARGYVFSPDGRQLVREMDEFAAMRTFPLPDTGIVRIPSSEHAVPLMTELMVANLLHDSGRRIAIDMPRRSAILSGEGDNAVWMHVAR